MSKRIIVAPLDWGLGHATRCVPLIRGLLVRGHEVFLGVTPLTEKILQEEFPVLPRFALPAAEIKYSSFLPVWAGIMLDYNRLGKLVEADAAAAEKICRENKIDLIISDNRYGFYCRNVKNIFVTHQLQVKSPVMERMANAVSRSYMKNFNEIWVPDLEDTGGCLSGGLSHKIKINVPVKYTGILSRLNYRAPDAGKNYEYTFLISGPEPKRSLFEKEAIKFINESGKKCALVRGTDVPRKWTARHAGCDIFDLPSITMLQQIISGSQVVVCRSGYSTLMDLVTLQRPAFLYPTPGQTEQVYLAGHLQQRFGFERIKKVSEIASRLHSGIKEPFDLKTSAALTRKVLDNL